MTKRVCPYCGSKRFKATAIVVQRWLIDETGSFKKVIDSCDSIVHHPGENDVWVCDKCGREMPVGKPYYFTFGSDEAFPYQNAYLVVYAYDHADAIMKFRAKYPDRPGHEGIYNASFSYSQEEWEAIKKDSLPVEVIV